MKGREHNPHLKATYLEVVENQLREGDPPETRQTLDRLNALGFGVRDAKLLIASAIAAETFRILKHGEPFNRDRLIRYLNHLPNQDFDAV